MKYNFDCDLSNAIDSYVLFNDFYHFVSVACSLYLSDTHFEDFSH